MKLFLIKVILFLIISIGAFQFIYFLLPYHIFDRGYPIYKYQLTESQKANQIEFLFLGDSRVVSSLNPELVPNSKNAGIVGSNPIESYFLLLKYLDNPSNQLKVVYLSYDWNRLGLKYWPNILVERGGLFDFYSLNDLNSIIELGESVDQNFVNEISLKDFFLAKLKSPHLIGSKIRKSLFQNFEKNKEIERIITSQNGHINGIWSTKSKCVKCVASEIKLKKFEIKPIYKYYFKRIVEICNSKNIKVIFETIPFNENSKEYLDKGVVSSYQAYIESINLEYPGNFISNKVWFLPDSLFEDGHHMNNYGARLYSNYFKNQLLVQLKSNKLNSIRMVTKKD